MSAHDSATARDEQRTPRFTRRRFLAGLGVLAGAAGLAPLLRRDAPTRVEVSRRALGTWVRVVARDRDERRAAHAIERAYAAIERTEQQMSIHRAASQLSQVNRVAGSEVAAVDDDVLEVVALACRAAEKSGGIYDPTVLPLMRLFGFYGAGISRMPSDAAISGALRVTGWDQVALDRSSGTLGLAHSGAGLDLGSIGKGWAVDRAVAAMKAEGVGAGLVDAGGNVFGFGDAEGEGEGWTIGVLHPVSRRVDRVFRLRDRAVATSGNAEQSRMIGATRIGHLFDARRGRPSNGHLSATVIAARAVDADLLSTVAFLLGPDRFDWPEAQSAHYIG